MVQSQFSLLWDSYKTNICNGFSYLQQKEELVDLTLAADGYFVKVHKVLLALSSPYLKELICSAPCQHPVIFLHDVSHATLCLILEYIYTGQVVVPSKNLNSFIKAAKSLHIKGLENADPEDNKLEVTPSQDLTDDPFVDDMKRTSSFNEKMYLPTNAKLISISRGSMENALDNIDTIEDHDETKDSLTIIDNMDIPDSDDVPPQKKSKRTYQTVDTQICKSLLGKETGSTTIQFTVSIRGSLQVILNRFIYNFHSTQACGIKRWRCVDYRNKTKKKCMAFVVTQGNVVLNRINLHCHSYHDKKILAKIEKNAVYSTIDDIEKYKNKEKKQDDSIGDSELPDSSINKNNILNLSKI